MWYEALPSLAIIGVCITMPQILIYFTHQLAFGTPYRRYVATQDDMHHFVRDARISGVGSPYNQINLKGFKVEEEEKKGGAKN